MSDTAAPSVQPRPWIMGRTADLLLFLAAPVWIVLAFAGLRQVVDSRTLQYSVMAFGSLGHNLPGMLRAYGDRALFRRFRTRFVVAPLAFGAASVAFALRGSGGLLLIAYLWAAWHALMQMYGFLRIYDARVGSTAPRIARLDLAMCLAWFVGAMICSDARVYYVQSLCAEFGAAPLSPAALHGVRVAAVVVIAALTLYYCVDLLRRWRAGAPISGLKHLLYVTSIGFWWYVHVAVADVLLGLIMFEVFHDVQYLAIVWAFNRRRADTDPAAGAFTRILFRRSGAMVLLYVGLCLAYGGLLPLTSSFELSTSGQLAVVVFVQTSALLHYYFDGFLWKVREPSTRAALGLQAGGGGERLVTRHGLKWLGLAAPAAVLYLLAVQPVSAQAAEALAVSTPGSAEAQIAVGVARLRSDRPGDAIVALQAALAITPGDPVAADHLAHARLQAGIGAVRAGRIDEARRLLELARQRIPLAAEETVFIGEQLRMQGKGEDAIVHYRAALLIAPDLAPAHLNLALALRDAGRRTEALEHARRGAQLWPADARAQQLVQELQSR
ncbi:MAG: hypothetical protein H6838_05335 [Planctomycetes bacterium]|nr:hypothetical protein [Planctomycetota bacterium]MCB9884893.1 hypothetical protein [Planctomycetota bacterium]